MSPLPPPPTPLADRVRAGLVAPLLALFLALAPAGPGGIPGGGPALAVEPSEMLADPELEARARAISKKLRCLVCQNQSIDDSEADLAHDLRVLVRQRLLAGDSDEEVIAFVVARYGEFVLLRPPVKPATYLLWFGPAVLALVGLAVALAYLRRRRQGPAPAPLSPEERARLARLLGEEEP